MTYDPGIIARDHAQGVFRQSFDQFAGRMVPPRMARGRRLMLQYASRSPASSSNTACRAVLVAIWGLETDFGADSGHFPTIRSLATLAYDCRRPDKFRSELIAALQIVDRGNLSPAEMHGAWAGEIGQTQFLSSSYLKYAVGRDLIHNPTNALASTANYLKGYGWQRGQPWAKAPPISRCCCNGIHRKSETGPLTTWLWTALTAEGLPKGWRIWCVPVGIAGSGSRAVRPCWQRRCLAHAVSY